MERLQRFGSAFESQLARLLPARQIRSGSEISAPEEPQTLQKRQQVLAFLALDGTGRGG